MPMYISGVGGWGRGFNSTERGFKGLSLKRVRPLRVEELPAPICDVVPVPCAPLETPLNPQDFWGVLQR